MAHDYKCDLIEWQQSGYKDTDDVKKFFGILSKISYMDSKARQRLIRDFGAKIGDNLTIINKYTDRDRLAIFNADCNKVILIFRGTDIKNKTNNRNRDLIADMWIAAGMTNKSKRYQESKKILDNIIREYGHDNVILTGHSMGGKMAYELSKAEQLPAISFNQFSSPLDFTSNDLNTHFTTNDISKIGQVDPFSISSTLLDDQKIIISDVKEGLTPHTIDNFIY